MLYIPDIALSAVREVFRRTAEKLTNDDDRTRGGWPSLPLEVQRWALTQAAVLVDRSIVESQEYTAKNAARLRDELDALTRELGR